jgi:LacI family transcriptional regulator
MAAGLLVSHAGIGTRVALPATKENGRGNGWRIIALLLPDITNRFYTELTEAVEYTALQRGYQLLLCSSRHQLALEEMHIRQLAARGVDGVILAHDPNLRTPRTLELLDEVETPYVFLFSSPVEMKCSSVTVDDSAGVEQVMRYLFSLGHRHIAFGRPLKGDQPHPREREYVRLMEQQVGEVPSRFVLPYESLDDAVCRATLEKLLATEPRPTALFAGNDRVALVLLKHLSAMGVNVPREMSVVGFDNLRFTEHLPVPLTTVDQPKQEMGRRAVELLLEQIELGSGDQPRAEVFHPHLVIRDSCAMAPGLGQ